MTPEQQEQFAAHLRDCLPLTPETAPLSFKGYAEQMLERDISHWRHLSLTDARAVMRAANRLKPEGWEKDTTGTCGTCRFGQPEHGSMVACALGWEAHDGLPPMRDQKLRRMVPVHAGHGELAAPLATADCGCGCSPSRWIGT